MSSFERYMHHTANILVGGTGLVYAIMRYFLEPADPFAVVNHPWQPHLQHLHILFAPLLVFAIAYSWQSHVAPRWDKKKMPRFWSGLVLLSSVVPMIVSGSLIQTAVSQEWRKVWVVVHLVASALWLFGYVGHQFGNRRKKVTIGRRLGAPKRKRNAAEVASRGTSPGPGLSGIIPAAESESESESDPKSPRAGVEVPQ